MYEAVCKHVCRCIDVNDKKQGHFHNKVQNKVQGRCERRTTVSRMKTGGRVDDSADQHS